MIVRMYVLVLIFAALFGACLWVLKGDDRSRIAKWTFRVAVCLGLGLAITLSIAFVETISK